MAKTGKTTTSQLIRQFSAGGVVYREDPSSRSGHTEWLVIKPARFVGASARRAGRETWRLPKGLIDKGETSLVAAQREVEEEAGVETEVVGKIGQDKYFFVLGKERIYKVVTYFLMRYSARNKLAYLQDAKGPISWETEEIAWLPFEEALERLTFKGEKEILKKAKAMLTSS